MLFSIKQEFSEPRRYADENNMIFGNEANTLTFSR